MRRERATTGVTAELLLCLSGPLLWAAHFFVLYGAATLACVASNGRYRNAFPSFAVIVTLAAMAVVLGLAKWQAGRTRWQNAEVTSFLRVLSILLAGAAVLAMLWALLPVLILPMCGGLAGDG